jgi:thiol-disulfide isomerase/thioredoxin
MERVNCPVCARSCAAQAKRCLGCGASLVQPATAPSMVMQESERIGLGALLRTLAVVALLAGAALGWRAYTVRHEEAAKHIAAQAALPVAAAVRPAPPAGALPVAQPTAPVVPTAAPSPESAPRAQIEAAPPRTVPSLPTFPWAEGARGFRSASNEQRASGCPMLLYFGTDWCPYCKQFDRAILSDSGVNGAIAPAVKVRIDPDKGDDERALATKFGVHGYPTLLLVARDGATPVRLPTGVSRGESPQPATFAKSVRSHLTYAWDSEASSNMSSGRLDDAIHGADLLLAFDPKYSNGRGYYLRAIAFHKKGQLSEALRDYRAGCAEGCTSCCKFGR